MLLRKRKSSEGERPARYYISNDDYYWLASRFCQNMMAFVFAATRYDEDEATYFEHFFIDFLHRRGIEYSIVHVDETIKQLHVVKPWERPVTK